MPENPSIASRLWLNRNGKRVKQYKYSRCKNIDDLEGYWLENIKKKTDGIKYDDGQLVIHIHGYASFDVWMPLELQKILTQKNIEIRYIFWGAE